MRKRTVKSGHHSAFLLLSFQPKKNHHHRNKSGVGSWMFQDCAGTAGNSFRVQHSLVSPSPTLSLASNLVMVSPALVVPWRLQPPPPPSSEAISSLTCPSRVAWRILCTSASLFWKGRWASRAASGMGMAEEWVSLAYVLLF